MQILSTSQDKDDNDCDADSHYHIKYDVAEDKKDYPLLHHCPFEDEGRKNTKLYQLCYK